MSDDGEIRKEKARLYYYKNREKRIAYQREWDKANKDKKAQQDAKRYGTKQYNIKQNLRHYASKYIKPILLEKFGKCQICGSTEKLQIHHIRYTKEVKDCLLVCSNCHKKLERK